MRILPYEILSQILEEATVRNLQNGPLWTYGLSQISGSARLQQVVIGSLAPDALMWKACEAIRQVNRQWHDWACNYALKSLYISRWKGSERLADPAKYLSFDFHLLKYRQMGASSRFKRLSRAPFGHRSLPRSLSLVEIGKSVVLTLS